jgi:membrane associated rhomboid family serine protease
LATVWHFRLAHIALNTLFQLLIGIPLEGIHGWRKVIIVYVVGGAIGKPGTLWMFEQCSRKDITGVMLGSNWHPFSYSMGSSGAIFVMLGCLFVTALFHPALPSVRYRFGVAFVCFMVVMCSVLQAELLFTDQVIIN